MTVVTLYNYYFNIITTVINYIMPVLILLFVWCLVFVVLLSVERSLSVSLVAVCWRKCESFSCCYLLKEDLIFLLLLHVYKRLYISLVCFKKIECFPYCCMLKNRLNFSYFAVKKYYIFSCWCMCLLKETIRSMSCCCI